MKKITIVVAALAVALTFAFAATAFATSAKTWNFQADYYTWGSYSGNGIGPVEDPATTNVLLSSVGANPTNPGVHANYLANTAKCGICHSVHRASATGVKLMNATVATCAGCHAATGGTVTSKLVSWQTGGPHSSGIAASCLNRTCHSSSPHGVGVSTYKVLASKLISVGADAGLAAAVADPTNSGISASDLNALPASTWTQATKDLVITGYTCNMAGCHEQTLLTVVKKGWDENRETLYPLGNIPGNQIMKTGHMGVAASNPASHNYTAVAGCTSCHDQTDAGTTSNFTFPHSQTPKGASNLGAGRAYLWMGYAAQKGDPLVAMGSGDKAFDGACLKCHRDPGSGAGPVGIGATY